MSVDPENVLPLMSAAAASVAREFVKIRFRDPIVEDFIGQCYRDFRGVLCIDLAPRLLSDCEKLLHVFLHECGHLHFGDVPENARLPQKFEIFFEKYGSFSSLNERERTKYVNDQGELAAESFAAQIGGILKYKTFETGAIEKRLRLLAETEIMKENKK